MTLVDGLNSILKNLKELFTQTSFWLSLLVILTAALVLPTEWTDALGLTKLRSDHQLHLVVLTVLSGALVLKAVVESLSAWIRRCWTVRAGKRYLRTGLTRDEKNLLCGYILNDFKTKYFHPADGTATGLLGKGILYNPSNVAGPGLRLAFRIHDWAWEFLNKNQRLITEGAVRDASGNVRPYEGP